MKFSFIKKITSHENKNKTKLQDGDLKVDLTIQKDNKEIEEEEEEKRGKASHINNIKNDGELLKPIPNTDRENEKDIDVEEEDICNRCKEKLGEEWKKPHWKWNLDKNIKFCFNCYKIKEIGYEKIINCCIICDSKLRFLRYNPRPEWKMKGQLCRKCWDSKNTSYKSEKSK